MTVANNDSNDNNENNDLRITSDELKKKIDNGEDIFILDVRNQHEHDAWSVSYDRYQNTPVIPVDTITSSAALKQIPKDKEIITFCTHGQRSSNAAKMLSELGYKVKTIEGGLDGWSNLYDIALVDIDSDILKNLANKTYIKGLYELFSCIIERQESNNYRRYL